MKTSILIILTTIIVTVLTYFLPVSRYWETFGWATAIALAVLSWQQACMYALSKETLARVLALNTRLLLRQQTEGLMRDTEDVQRLRHELALAESFMAKHGVHMADLKHGERIRQSQLSPRS